MAVVNPPAYLQNSAAHSAKLFRRAFGGLIGAEGIVAYNGAVAFGVSNDLNVVQRAAGANMSIDVARGGAYIKGDDATDQGYYFFYNDATTNVVITAADPTNPRIDLVIARIKDVAEGGAAGDTSTLEIVLGTPAGSPSPPAIPASSLKLAEVRVNAGVASITNAVITDFRNMAVTSLFERATPSVKVRAPSTGMANPSAILLGMTTELWDTDGFHDNVTNPSRITIPSGFGGIYNIQGCVHGSANWTVASTITVYKNGSAISGDYIGSASSFFLPITPLSLPLQLNAGDYVELFVSNSGNAQTIQAGELHTWFSATKIA